MKDENKPVTQAELKRELGITKTELKRELEITKAEFKRELEITQTELKRELEITQTELKRELEITQTELKRELEITQTELKRELKDVVRKKDLEKYATRDWVEDKFERAKNYFVSRIEFNEFRDWVKANMVTKGEILPILDAIVGRLDEMALDLKLAAGRTDRLKDASENHEKRIVKIETRVFR